MSNKCIYETTSRSAASAQLGKVRSICAVKYNPATLPIAVKKCKDILTDYDRCLCHIIPTVLRMGSIELTTLVTTKGKKNCGFCQIKIDTLYDLIKHLPFYVIQGILTFSELMKIPNVAFSILEMHLYEMTTKFIRDTIEHLFSPATTTTTDIQVIRRLTVIIHKNICHMNKAKKDGVFIIFYEIIRYLKTIKASPVWGGTTADELEELTANIIHIMDAIVKNNLLDNVDKTLVTDLMFCNFKLFKQTISNAFHKRLKSNAIQTEQEEWAFERRIMFKSFELTNVYIARRLIEYDQQICHIDDAVFSFMVQQLSYDELVMVVKKINSACMILLISNCLYVYSPTRYFDLHVDPMDILNSPICKGINLYSTIDQFVLYPNQKPYIIYENENGQMGIDAGGLTRDFYTQYFLQLKEWMVVKDDVYMGFRRAGEGGRGGLGGVNSLARVRMAGVLTAYSMFREHISPNIRFHPLISYFVVYGSTIQIDHLLDYLADEYDIEYAKNLRKILRYTPAEYSEYMNMQGEDATIPVKKYLQGVIQDHYVSPATIAFVRGFRDVFICQGRNADIFSNVRPCIIHEYMAGIDSYKIMGAENSLDSILKIDCGDNKSISAANCERIRRVFLEVLDELNREDMPKLKSLLRFWHGTHGIHDFRHLDLTLRLLWGEDDLYGCFSSSTCFGKLYVHHSHLVVVSEGKLRKVFVDHIDRTLENQRLVETAGMYMQMD
jgi:hypothetical protein